MRQGTSHEIWESPITNERFSVPRHDSQEIRTGTLENIKKQAGINPCPFLSSDSE